MILVDVRPCYSGEHNPRQEPEVTEPEIPRLLHSRAGSTVAAAWFDGYNFAVNFAIVTAVYKMLMCWRNSMYLEKSKRKSN